MSTDLTSYTEIDFCYLMTTGRVSGRPHTIEIWFALHDRTIYLLSGGGDRSDWIKNALRQPTVHVKLGEQVFVGHARPVHDPQEDARARALLLQKYAPRSSDDLVDWARTSLPLAIDLQAEVQQ